MSRKKYEHPPHEQLLKRLQHQYTIYATSEDEHQVLYAQLKIKDLCRQLREVELPARVVAKCIRALERLQASPRLLEVRYPEGEAALVETISFLSAT